MQTICGQQASDTATQDGFVAGLVERLLGVVEHGRVVIASLDGNQQIIAIQDVAIGSCAKIEDCGWELRSSVAREAKGVIVGYHTASTAETELFARTIGGALAVAILGVVVAPSRARARQQSDIVPANGWLRRSTA